MGQIDALTERVQALEDRLEITQTISAVAEAVAVEITLRRAHDIGEKQLLFAPIEAVIGLK